MIQTMRPWWQRFREDQSSTEKGKHAVDVAIEALRAGKFPLWVYDARETEQTNLQIKGTDLMLTVQWKIQVKCDYWAGRGDDGQGTGNLYLQVAELNPLKRY
jgi:hypothetical protein